MKIAASSVTHYPKKSSTTSVSFLDSLGFNYHQKITHYPLHTTVTINCIIPWMLHYSPDWPEGIVLMIQLEQWKFNAAKSGKGKY